MISACVTGMVPIPVETGGHADEKSGSVAPEGDTLSKVWI
jgi:hypothetical protein